MVFNAGVSFYAVKTSGRNNDEGVGIFVMVKCERNQEDVLSHEIWSSKYSL